MPLDEQIERMRLMRTQIKENNVYRWAGSMLIDAARSRKRDRILALAASRETGGSALTLSQAAWPLAIRRRAASR
jgi:trehalose 6-phosphate synthase